MAFRHPDFVSFGEPAGGVMEFDVPAGCVVSNHRRRRTQESSECSRLLTPCCLTQHSWITAVAAAAVAWLGLHPMTLLMTPTVCASGAAASTTGAEAGAGTDAGTDAGAGADAGEGHVVAVENQV